MASMKGLLHFSCYYIVTHKTAAVRQALVKATTERIRMVPQKNANNVALYCSRTPG